jgi:hypothetical protein
MTSWSTWPNGFTATFGNQKARNEWRSSGTNRYDGRSNLLIKGTNRYKTDTTESGGGYEDHNKPPAPYTTSGPHELVGAYLTELHDQGGGPHTVRAYRVDLGSYVDHLAATGRQASGRSASRLLRVAGPRSGVASAAANGAQRVVGVAGQGWARRRARRDDATAARRAS